MTCGRCGAANPSSARFCNACGAELVLRPEERRVVTVLFADLVGFTGLAEGLDPEAVKRFVDRCFERLVADIEEFGGRVDKIVGDAIVALFGAPVAHEDDAERAVRAALRLHETVARVADDRGTALEVRVGVNTGEVLVGSLRAGGDYTAMGDVVNIAQRLQMAARPGAVVVGPATWAATAGAIEYEALGDVQAKGREEPVAAWVARRALQPPGYRRRRAETPFVGREPELALLRHAVAAAVTRRRAQLVLLTGDAGVGKTRLAEEAARVGRAHHDALVLEGRCVPYGEANVWWPLAEAVRQLLDLPADADRRDAEAACRAALGPGADDGDRAVHGVLHLLGYDVPLRAIDPVRGREEVVRSLRRLFGAVLESRPLVLVVGDVHWADAVVVDLLAELLGRLARAPFVLIATTRPAHGTLLASVGNAVALALDPLDAEASADLLGALAPPDLAAEARTSLLDRAGGNPLFLEELVALLAPDGGPSETVHELPDTLRGLVAARIDALSPAERDVLEDASVWGRRGSRVALERMADAIRGRRDIAAELAALDAAGVLAVTADGWSFRSEVVREVTYGTLTKHDRAQRHAGIAQYLASEHPDPAQAPDRTVDVVAHHYAAAAALLADLGEGPDLVPSALQWLGQAAWRAEMTRSLPVVERLYGQALELAHGTERVPYLLGRAAALGDQRRPAAARVDLDEARALAAGDEALATRVALVEAEIAVKEGDLAPAVVTLGDVVSRFEALGDVRGAADAQRLRGMASIFLDDFPAAEVAVRGALAGYREVGDRRGEAWALQNLAWISFLEGRTEEAEERLHRSASTFAELGDAGGLSWARGLLAFVRFHGGRLAEAEGLAEQILGEARERGDRWGEGMMLLVAAGVRLWSGRADEAVAVAAQAREVFEALGDRFGIAQSRAAHGRALVNAGAVREGLDLLRRSLDGATPDLAGLAVVGLATAAAQVGEPDLALAAVASDATRVRDEGLGAEEAGVAAALALAQSGRIEDAVEALLPVVDRQPSAGSSAYASAVFALVLAAAGRPVGEVSALADAVRGLPRATYADRALGRLAELIAGAPGSYGDLLEDLAEVGDVVLEAVVLLAAATAATAAGDDGAVEARRRADDALAALDMPAPGWRRLLGQALGVPPAEAAVPG